MLFKPIHWNRCRVQYIYLLNDRLLFEDETVEPVHQTCVGSEGRRIERGNVEDIFSGVHRWHGLIDKQGAGSKPDSELTVFRVHKLLHPVRTAVLRIGCCRPCNVVRAAVRTQAGVSDGTDRTSTRWILIHVSCTYLMSAFWVEAGHVQFLLLADIEWIFIYISILCTGWNATAC